MTSFRALVAASAVLMASTVAVSAADLNGGRGSIRDDRGCGASSNCGGSYGGGSSYSGAGAGGCPTSYVRVDGGYSTMDRPTMSQAYVDDMVRTNIKDTWSIGGGIGRYFTCNLRGDITYDHRHESDVTGRNLNVFSPANGDIKFKMSNDVVLANVYYDFDTRSRFTPYLGIGLGFTKNEIGAASGIVASTASFNGGGTLSSPSSSNWSAAAAAMAGFTVALRQELLLDAGYRFLYLGNASTGKVVDQLGRGAGPDRLEDLHAHEFRVGLRYQFGSGGPGCCAAPAPLK
jgi:opacity protein-like surface antigen